MEFGYQVCKKQAECMGKDCEVYNIMNSDHSFSHDSQHPNHSINSLEFEYLKAKNLSAIKSQIKKYILKISEDTQTVILNLKKTSKCAIQNLKQVNLNIENIEHLKPVVFDSHRVNFLALQVRLIGKPFEACSTDEEKLLFSEVIARDHSIKDLNSKLHKYQEKVAQLKIEKEKQYKKTNKISKRLSIQAEEFSKLYSEINQKETLIQDKNCKIEELQRTLSSPDVLRKIVKEFDEKIKPIKGKPNSEFQKLNLEKKEKFIKKQWKFVNLDRKNKEILMSNDGNYLFQCNE